jgi:hypothetical protein
MGKTTLWLSTAVAFLAALVVPGGSSAGTACAPAAVSIGDVAQREGTGTSTQFRFPVTVTAEAGCAAVGSVRYRTGDGAPADRGPASAGTDYAAQAGVLTWNGDNATRYVTVSVSGDRQAEQVEVFWVSLDTPSGVSVTGRTGAGWISDDDTPGTDPEPDPDLCPPGDEECTGRVSTEGTGVCWTGFGCFGSVHFSDLDILPRDVHVRTLGVGGSESGYLPIEDQLLTVRPGDRRATVRFTITAHPNQEVRIPVEFFAPSAGVEGNMRTTLTLVKG